MRAFTALCLLFILVYTKGAMDRLGLPEVASKFIVEGALLLLILPILRRREFHLPPGLLWVALFALLTVLSGIVSGDGLYQSLLYFRQLLYAYIVFWVVWNARLTGREIMRLNTLVLGLWILQVLASLFHVLVLGERVEAHVGTITASSGSPATALPLFAMVYVLAIYCYYKRSIWLLLLALSFVLVGYSSGKRAIFFYVPVVYGAVFIWYAVRERAVRLRPLVVPIALFALCIPILVFGLTDSNRFDHLQGERLGTVLTEAFDLAREYNNRVYASGETSGRTATSEALLSRMFGEDWSDYLLGLGPASMRISSGDRGKIEEGISYGAVGWVENTISVGWPAMIAHVAFYLVLWFKLCRLGSVLKSGYLKALSFSCHLGFAVYFLMYFTYTYSYVMTGWLTFVQMYVVAIILSPKHTSILEIVNRPKALFGVRSFRLTNDPSGPDFARYYIK